MFAETRPEAIEDMRQAADELRRELAGDTVTFVVNRNINVSNVCTVGCAFCGFGQGRRSPDAYEHDREELERRVRRGGGVRRHRDLHAVRHPPRLGARGLRALAADGEGGRARSIHLHAYSPMEVAHMCDVSGLSPDEVFERLTRRRPRLHAGHGRRGAARRRARADLAEQAAGGPLGRGDRGLARGRPALDGDRDVRPRGGAVGAGRAHARGPRAPGAHRRLHRVRAAVVHPVPHAARPHARDRGDLDRGEPQAHRRVPARARADDAEPPGELGEDGPGRGHRGAALGRERPRRHADGGEHQPPGRARTTG